MGHLWVGGRLDHEDVGQRDLALGVAVLVEHIVLLLVVREGARGNRAEPTGVHT